MSSQLRSYAKTNLGTTELNWDQIRSNPTWIVSNSHGSFQNHVIHSDRFLFVQIDMSAKFPCQFRPCIKKPEGQADKGKLYVGGYIREWINEEEEEEDGTENEEPLDVDGWAKDCIDMSSSRRKYLHRAGRKRGESGME